VNKAYVSVHNLDDWTKKLDNIELGDYIEDLIPVARLYN
jgi:hypothetical protein